MSLGQKKSHSAFESVANIAAGSVISGAVQIVVFPMFGIVVPLATNFWLVVIFTGASFVRSYALRRAFNIMQIGKRQ